MVRDYLRKHPEACKWNHASHGGTHGKRPQGGGKEHEHGSVTCVAAFLGETNWNRTKVGVLLEIAASVTLCRAAPFGPLRLSALIRLEIFFRGSLVKWAADTNSGRVGTIC